MADFNVNFILDEQTLILHDTSVARAEEAADRAETAAVTIGKQIEKLGLSVVDGAINITYTE